MPALWYRFLYNTYRGIKHKQRYNKNTIRKCVMHCKNVLIPSRNKKVQYVLRCIYFFLFDASWVSEPKTLKCMAVVVKQLNRSIIYHPDTITVDWGGKQILLTVQQYSASSKRHCNVFHTKTAQCLQLWIQKAAWYLMFFVMQFQGVLLRGGL